LSNIAENLPVCSSLLYMYITIERNEILL